jgi:hypothetical protein
MITPTLFAPKIFNPFCRARRGWARLRGLASPKSAPFEKATTGPVLEQHRDQQLKRNVVRVIRRRVGSTLGEAL